MRRLLFLVVVATSCSYTFDTTEPSLPYLGQPLDAATLPKLNDKPVSGEAFAKGADGRVWLIMQHSNDMQWEMKPMSGAPDYDTIDPNQQLQLVSWRALYITKRGGASGVVDGGVPPDLAVGPDMAQPRSPDMGAAPPPDVTLVVRSVGEHPGREFTVPDGPALIYSLGADDVFAYIVTDPSLPGYILQRRDGSFRRVVPWPAGIDPANPFKNGLFFGDTGAGDVFYDRDGEGRIVGHHTRDNVDIDLGIRPRFLAWLDAKTLVTCGNDGVRVVPVDGVTPERILDEEICKPSLLWINGGYVYYVVDTTIRKTRVDGSAAPTAMYDLGTNRLISISVIGDSVIYSTDPADRYARGAGDGWLGNWRFMERGLGVNFTRDRRTLTWLEHAAQGSAVGDLTIAQLDGPAVPGATPRTLTKNTRQYNLLADGRIICDENRANGGTWNRIVLVDWERGHKQYVVTGANHFSLIPERPTDDEYIVDVISGATGHDIARVTIPPIVPTVPPNK